MTADARDRAAVARIRAEAVNSASVLNGAPLKGGENEALFRRYFAWQRCLPASSKDRKADLTMNENENTSQSASC